MIHRPLCIALPLLLSLATACGGDSGDNGGNPTDGGGETTPDADLNVEPTAFRITKLALLDPHPFAINQSFDVVGVVNDSITAAVDGDAPPEDGVLDLNLALVFRPLDTTAASAPMAITFPTCSAPLASTVCMEEATTTVINSVATNQASDCLDALPGTVAPYDPPVVAVPGPCFVSSAVDVTVNLGTVTLPLKGAQVAATFDGAEPTTLSTGLLRGFVTKTDADAILIPDTVALVGGEPLSTLLTEADMDVEAGTDGWWFYISLEAATVDYTFAE